MIRKLNPKEEDLLFKIKQKSELQPFFFKEVKGLHWFDSLEKDGYFAPDKNPQPVPAEEEGYVIISPWLALEYLVATAPEIETTQNKEYGENFLKILRESTQYAKENNFSNWRTWWQLAQILRQLPVDIVKENDLDLVDYWLDDNFGQSFLTDELIINWLPKLMSGNTHSKQLALKLIDIVFSPNKDNKIRFQIWYIKHKSQNLFTSIGKELGLKAAKILESKLITVLGKLQNDSWSYVRRSAIEEDDEQNHQADDAIDILIVSYRDCLLEITNDNSVELKEYLQELLNSQYETLKRVAIYIISQGFDQFKGLSELIIVQEYFNKNNLRHELWDFLNQHYNNLLPTEKNKVLEIINNIVRRHEDESPDERATAYGKSIWLNAIKDFDEQLTIQYQDAIKTSGTEPEHPDFASYMTVRSENSQPTIPSATMEEWRKSLSVRELIEAVEKYKTSTIPGRFEDWGIIQTFNDIIKEKIKVREVYQELSKLDDIDLAYKRYIIDMFHNVWNEQAKLPWDDIWLNLFEFCKKIIDNEDFWIAKKQQTEEYYSTENRNLVSSISNLIEDGVKSDDHAFASKLLPEAKKILLLILEKQKGDEFKFDTDAVSLAINSPRGRCLIALLSLSLRECRLSDQENGSHIDKWNEYQGVYGGELEKSKEYEFITILTFRLPNFFYLSEQWVLGNLDKIFDKDDYQKWLCVMQGMVYVNPYGEDIYKYLYNHGYLIDVLDEKNLKKEVKESVVKNIAMAYIHNYESLDDPDSLISILLQRHKHEELLQLIWFISTARKKDISNIYNKILELWSKLINILNLTTKEDKKLASSLCRWSAFISEINDSNRNLLLEIARYSDYNQNSYELLENLAEISKTQHLEVYKIWMEMPKSDIFYPKDAIKEILSNLKLHNAEEQAIEIVGDYIKSGNDEPKRIWEEIKSAA